MILSYEHAELKREYLIKEIDKLPVGHEIMLRQKYPGRDIIFSYESDKVPLDPDIVKQQINALIMANTLKK